MPLPATAIVRYGRYRGDSSSDGGWGRVVDDNDEDDDESGYVAIPKLGTSRKKATGPMAALVIFDTSSGRLEKLFSFTGDIPFVLCASPPVIHPPLSTGCLAAQQRRCAFRRFHAENLLYPEITTIDCPQ